MGIAMTCSTSMTDLNTQGSLEAAANFFLGPGDSLLAAGIHRPLARESQSDLSKVGFRFFRYRNSTKEGILHL